MATTRPDKAESRQAPTPEGAGWNVPGMSAQYRLHAHLGRSLQVAYQPVIEEPVPGRLLKLVAGIRRKEEGG
jgi:hypothetical protein